MTTVVRRDTPLQLPQTSGNHPTSRRQAASAHSDELGGVLCFVARRSRLPAFVDLHRKITAPRDAIDATLDHGLSNTLVGSTNTKIRLLTRIAFGFHGHQPLIGLAILALGSHPPRLPGR